MPIVEAFMIWVLLVCGAVAAAKLAGVGSGAHHAGEAAPRMSRYSHRTRGETHRP